MGYREKEKYEAHREQIPEREYEEGAVFPCLGGEQEVVVEPRPSSSVTENIIRLAKHRVEDTPLKRTLETLYRDKARETFEERTESFAEEMGVEYGK
jgi:predicted metal-dependent hydrolase